MGPVRELRLASQEVRQVRDQVEHGIRGPHGQARGRAPDVVLVAVREAEIEGRPGGRVEMVEDPPAGAEGGLGIEGPPVIAPGLVVEVRQAGHLGQLVAADALLAGPQGEDPPPEVEMGELLPRPVDVLRRLGGKPHPVPVGRRRSALPGFGPERDDQAAPDLGEVRPHGVEPPAGEADLGPPVRPGGQLEVLQGNELGEALGHLEVAVVHVVAAFPPARGQEGPAGSVLDRQAAPQPNLEAVSGPDDLQSGHIAFLADIFLFKCK